MSETIYTEKAYKELQSQANNLAVDLMNTKVALREAVKALRFILDECDWEEDKRISDACRKILAKYQEIEK